MRYSEVLRNLYFGNNLFTLKLEIVGHEKKPDRYSFPGARVEEIKENFEDYYGLSPDILPTPLSSRHIPERFYLKISEKDPEAVLMISLGYSVGSWWQVKFHGGEILARLESNLAQNMRDLNAKLPGMKAITTEILDEYRDREFSEDVGYELFEQIALAIDEHFEREREESQEEKPLEYSLAPSTIEEFEKKVRTFRPPEPTKMPFPSNALQILQSPLSKLTIFEEPFVLPLLPYLDAAKEKTAPEIQILKEKWDFYLLKFSIGAKPDNKEQISEVDLHLDYPSGMGILTYSLVPNTELEERFSASIKGEAGLNGNLGITPLDIATPAPGISVGGGFRTSVEASMILRWSYRVLKAKVIARGKSGSFAEWQIRKPERMVGDIDFSIVIRVPKSMDILNVKVSGYFKLKRGMWWWKEEIPYQIPQDTKKVTLK